MNIWLTIDSSDPKFFAPTEQCLVADSEGFASTVIEYRMPATEFPTVFPKLTITVPRIEGPGLVYAKDKNRVSRIEVYGAP